MADGGMSAGQALTSYLSNAMQALLHIGDLFLVSEKLLKKKKKSQQAGVAEKKFFLRACTSLKETQQNKTQRS
jgi:hypothetical protein